jgi:hypothetical protein
MVLGVPAIFIGKQLAGIQGIFVALACTYVMGGIISLLVNRQVMKQVSEESVVAG